MKASYRLFVGLSVFYAIMAVIYYYVGGEAVGITCISLSSGLAGIVGFYVWFNSNRMGLLPQDNLRAWFLHTGSPSSPRNAPFVD